MKKKLLIVVVLLGSCGLLMGPALLGLVSILFSASAQATQNPCVTSVVAPVGGPVRLPVTGAFRVTSEFGMRYNPGQYGNGVYRLHAGLDMAMPSGSRYVVAASGGAVTSLPVSPTGGGNMVVVDHGGGVTTTYSHLASRSVSVGQQVWAGMPLGVQGTTGNSTGPHLHFSVTISGKPTDPRPWLTGQGVALPPPDGSAIAPPPATSPPAGSSSTSPSTPVVSTPGTGTVDSKPVVAALPTRIGPYSGEQVRIGAYIIKAGQAMGLDAKTITIGLMAGMGESSLTNVAHGDAVRNDTIGVFQIGPEHGSYAQRMDPTWSAGNFFTRLTAVPNYLSLEPTVAAHKAQRNADAYHYAPYWPNAVLMMSTLTADPSLLESLPAGGVLAGCEDGGPGAPPAPGNGTGAAVVEAAKRYLGTPYSWGGGNYQGPSLGIYTSGSLDGSRTVGFDCSGLVMFAVYNATGTKLSHSAEAQGRGPSGVAVPRDWSKMQPGDVISFSEDGSGAAGSFGHVGIYAGNGQMIHASRPGVPVALVQLKGSKHYESMAWSIRRYSK